MRYLHRVPRPAGLLCIAGCCLTLAACGSSDSSSGPTGAGSAADARNAAQTRLRNCLSQQGIDVPAGAPGAGGAPANFDSDRFQAAMNGPCKQYASGAFGNFNPSDPATQDRLTKFSQCMRDNGVDVPDLGSGGAPPAGGAQIDRNDPTVQAAVSKCQSTLGNVPGLAGGGN